MVGKLWKQGHDGAVHIVSTVRRQKEMHAGAPFFFPLLFSLSLQLEDGDAHTQIGHPILLLKFLETSEYANVSIINLNLVKMTVKIAIRFTFHSHFLIFLLTKHKEISINMHQRRKMKR